MCIRDRKQTDAERILGKWVIESATQGGTVYDKKGDVWVFAPLGEKSVQNCKGGTNYSLDYSFPDAGEKQIDVACNGIPYLGVYEIDGDSLSVAFRSKVRPTGVEREKGVFFFTFRRKTDEPPK